MSALVAEGGEGGGRSHSSRQSASRERTFGLRAILEDEARVSEILCEMWRTVFFREPCEAKYDGRERMPYYFPQAHFPRKAGGRAG